MQELKKFSWGGTARGVSRRKGKGRNPVCICRGVALTLAGGRHPLGSHSGCPRGIVPLAKMEAICAELKKARGKGCLCCVALKG